ncbi:hypothetical protein V3C99_013914, partial [Haemonchus contortus]
TIDEFFDRQEILISKLLTGYRKDIPPIYSRVRSNPSLANPMLVNVSLSYMKLLSINEPEETIMLIFEYFLNWNDPRLRWNPSDFHGIDGFFVNRDSLWRPDILPYDAQSISDARDSDIQHIHVKSNGDMTYLSSSVMTLVCPIDIRKFPFDQQVCEVGLVSYNFLSRELHLTSTLRLVFNMSESANGEWAINEVSSSDTIPEFEGTLLSYDTVVFTIRLSRSSTFYIVMIILPSFVLTFLCVLGLFWTKFGRTDYLEKLGLGFAAIIAMCTVLEIAEQSIPKTRQLPSISVFIMVNLLLLTIAISIVVMGSKSCEFTTDAKLSEFKRKYVPAFGKALSRSFRLICLVLFPTLTVINLLILLLNT